MNEQELSDIKQRIADAEQKKRRVTNLADAVSRVSSNEITGLQFPLNAEVFEMYYQNEEARAADRWYRVCWFTEEDGLTEEIHAAVLGVLKSRLEAAKTDWESA